MSDWWSRIGLQRKLQILIQGFLLLVFIGVQHWISARFEERAMLAAHERTTAVADGAINGLNTLMDITVGGKDVPGNGKIPRFPITRQAYPRRVRSPSFIPPTVINHECIQRRARAERASLDRQAVYLHHDPRSVPAVLERSFHDDRPARQRQAAAARLQHRQRQL